MMMPIYLITNYLAPIVYYKQLASERPIYIEKECNYVKQTYRNRCVIAGANGKIALSIPIEKPKTLKCLTKDIRISNHGNWRHLHWFAIQSAYRSTPYFDYYEDDFCPFYEKQFDYLFDFNEALRELICRLIDIHPKVHYTSTYCSIIDDGLDLREKIHPKIELSSDENYSIPSYYQVFAAKYGFIPNLSIIDLLFNMGPESSLLLRQRKNFE